MLHMPDHQGRVDGPRPRFPIPRYPTGWFQVAWSNEIEPGEAKPIEAFGQSLVAFRSEAGVVKVLDAYCPHLGAHLGQGGSVEGDELVCPFHAWKFNGDGVCTEIPYARKIPPKAKLPCWPVNDFKYLHGTVNFPDAEVEAKDHIFHMVSPTTMTTPGGQVESISMGFGFATNRFTGLVETLLIGAVTPIDDEYVQVRFSFTVKKIGGRDITKGVGRAFVAEISRQLEQDKPVWEHKVYFERPLLCDGDGPFMKLRKWGRQFFPEWYLKEAHDAFHA